MPSGDQMRAYRAALTYIGSQMQPADLLAILVYEGGSVRLKQDFTDDKAQLQLALAEYSRRERRFGQTREQVRTSAQA